MIFIIDKDIPYAAEMFAGRAKARLIPGDEIGPDSVRDADVLIVRSPTRVTGNLLSGSRIRFVGSATIGYDHIDLGYLKSQGILFLNAPGCNSNSVAEYVIAALLELGARSGRWLGDMSLGIVGVGNVGSRVARKASALGMTVLMNDPPLARAGVRPGDGEGVGGAREFVPLDALMEADIITLHVPLTKSGPDPTYHLFNGKRMSSMKPGSALINTARGPVVETGALKANLRGNHLSAAVLDVWEGEPLIDLEALSMVEIGTAHIAGYSTDAKTRGALMMYDAVCDFLGWEKTWRPSGDLPPPPIPEITIAPGAMNEQEVIHGIVGKCYPITRDDARLRPIARLSADQQSGHFISLRNNYPLRREFSATRISYTGNNTGLRKSLSGLGFEVSL